MVTKLSGSSQITSASVDLSLARRIEEASLNAWPAMNQTFLDGWILRFSRGFTKRANSIVPLYPPMQSTHTLLQKIRYCENLYAREQLQTIFRLNSIDEPFPAANGKPAETLDQILEARGYRLAETTLVLTTQIRGDYTAEEIDLLPLDHWLDAYCELTGMTEPARSLHGVILKAIQGDCAFAVLRDGDQPAAIGLAVVERDLLGLFDIYTGEHCRGRGFATRLVKGLLGWGQENRADRAYLQMLETNAPAAALYTALGFEEVYRYWYRIAP